jgi:hypothetical protein
VGRIDQQQPTIELQGLQRMFFSLIEHCSSLMAIASSVKERFEDAGYSAADIKSALNLNTPGISTGVANVSNAGV